MYRNARYFPFIDFEQRNYAQPNGSCRARKISLTSMRKRPLSLVVTDQYVHASQRTTARIAFFYVNFSFLHAQSDRFSYLYQLKGIVSFPSFFATSIGRAVVSNYIYG